MKFKFRINNYCCYLVVASKVTGCPGEAFDVLLVQFDNHFKPVPTAIPYLDFWHSLIG